MMRQATLWFGVLGLTGMTGCGTYSAAPTEQKQEAADELMAEEESVLGRADRGGGAPSRRNRASAKKSAEMAAPMAPPPPGAAESLMDGFASDDAEGAAAPEEPADGDDGGGERTREWFPESFLWQPLVETGSSGSAELRVRVPDQLTTWRLLGLGLTRDGQQAGDVLTFDTRMDVFVEPVTPGWLYAGDRLDLPVQVVNSTSDPVTASLSLVSEGTLTGGGAGAVAVSAGGSRVWTVPLQARGAGAGTVEARLPGHDAARREVIVHPTGRPSVEHRGGTLAAPRTFPLVSPPGVDPDTQRLEVQVFPGPLAMVQAEVERAQRLAPGGPAQAAYLFALADQLATLGARSGADVDADAVRALQMRGWQRLVRHARSRDPGAARDMLLALQHVEGHALAEDLRDVFVQQVIQAQRGDGTWQTRSRSDIQQTLVETAITARLLPESEVGPRLRAAGALERHAGRIDDAYTAAVVLSTGLVSPTQADRLRALVVEQGLTSDIGGAREVLRPSGVHNAWGTTPTLAEIRAVTFLADPEADWAGDVLSGLLASWDAGAGFGAGPADVLALEAMVAGLPPLTDTVDVVLSIDGEEVARQSLDPSQPRDPALLLARPGGGSGTVSLRSEPEVPGLVFASTLRSWSAWTGQEGVAGVDVELEASPLQVGRSGALNVTLAAPSNAQLTLVVGLPAGAEVDEARLAAVPGLTAVEVHPDHVRLTTKRFGAGEIIEVPIPVRPAFAGRFSSRPVGLQVAGRGEHLLAPVVWTVEP